MGLDIVKPPPRALTTAAEVGEHGSLIIDWPVVILTLRTGSLSPASTDVLSAFTSELFSLGERFGLVFDFQALDTMPDATVRRRVADFQKENSASFGRYVVADASVINSPIARGLLTAISWLSSPTHPERYFSERADAIAWVREMLAADRAMRSTG